MVIALDKALPTELVVPGLGGDGGQVGAQGIGVVLAEEIGNINDCAAALAELAATKAKVFLDTEGKIPSVCLRGWRFVKPEGSEKAAQSSPHPLRRAQSFHVQGEFPACSVPLASPDDVSWQFIWLKACQRSN